MHIFNLFSEALKVVSNPTSKVSKPSNDPSAAKLEGHFSGILDH